MSWTIEEVAWKAVQEEEFGKSDPNKSKHGPPGRERCMSSNQDRDRDPDTRCWTDHRTMCCEVEVQWLLSDAALSVICASSEAAVKLLQLYVDSFVSMLYIMVSSSRCCADRAGNPVPSIPKLLPYLPPAPNAPS